MNFNSLSLCLNPFFLIFTAAISGLFLGKIKLGRYRLATSGCLFTGLLLGWYVYKKCVLPFIGLDNIPDKVGTIINNGLIPEALFSFSLILFIASVGLIAAKDVGKIYARYGIKLIILGFLIPLSGALVIGAATFLWSVQTPFELLGVYVGGLTSSPGLAAALESTTFYGTAAGSRVGFGYAIGYIPGVIVVILSMQLIPALFRLDLEKETKEFACELQKKLQERESSPAAANKNQVFFDLVGFFSVCLFGLCLGEVSCGNFRLGTTGGVLISSLVLGHLGKMGPISFRMDPRILGVIKEISLAMFLTIVGLRYGYTTINSSIGHNAGALLLVAAASAIFAILIGFVVGRYVFKLNWILLSGAICGGMTSTPGLGAAIDATSTNDVAAGYGATYPFALTGMILFTYLLCALIGSS